MADQANPNTATPTPSGLAPANQNGQSQPGGGAQFSVPEGYTLARKDEYDTFKRQAEQYNGVKPYWEKGSKYGLKSVEDWDRFGPVLETLNKRKEIDPRQLAAMLSDEADADLGSDNKPAFDPVKYREETMSEVRRELATKEWEQLSAREKDHVDAALKDIFGDDTVDDMTKSVYRMAAERWLDQNRELYPKDHPLHGQYLKPFGESEAKKAAEFFKAEKAKHAGASKAAKADAAIAAEKKGVTTTAGRSGGNGAPAPKKPRSSYDPHDTEAIAAQHEAIKARRAAR